MKKKWYERYEKKINRHSSDFARMYYVYTRKVGTVQDHMVEVDDEFTFDMLLLWLKKMG